MSQRKIAAPLRDAEEQTKVAAPGARSASESGFSRQGPVRAKGPLARALSRLGWRPAQDGERPPNLLWRRFYRRKLSLVGLIVVGIYMLMAILAPLIAPWGPIKSDLAAASSPPSATHWLGTDRIGRDVWARMVYGARVSLVVPLAAVMISLSIGVTLGGLAGYTGGLTDSVIMRFTDAVMAFPTLLLIITLAAALPPSVFNIVFILGLFGWPSLCRLVRGQVLYLRQQDFVTAAVSLGVSRTRIIFRHLLPNAIVQILVYGILEMGYFIIAEAGLSFLGFGVREPTPSWGQLMSVAMQLPILEFQLWIWLPPAVAIILYILSVNFIGDGLMYAIDPRLARSR